MAGEKLVKKALDFLRANPELKPYKGGSFSLERQGVYNPKYFDLKKDDLVDEAGNIIASKNVTVPREGFFYDLPAQADPNKIFRGMSAEEFANFQKNNYLQSLGTHNIGESQKGLTYFSVNPDEARSYAHSFAPSEFKPDPSRPAYVVAVKRPPDKSIVRVPGTGESEVGVIGQIPRESVTNVYRGNVVDYIEGIHEPKGGISPRASVYWEEINDYAHGGSVDAALNAVRQHFDEGGFLQGLRDYFTSDGKDYQSSNDLSADPLARGYGAPVVQGDRINWGDPDNKADFVRADKAYMARRAAEATATAPDDRTDRVRVIPVERKELLPVNAAAAAVGTSPKPVALTPPPPAPAPAPSSQLYPVSGTFVGGPASHYNAPRGTLGGYMRLHAGTDWQADNGSPVFSTTPGKVVYVGNHSGYGNMVDIQTPDGTVLRYAVHSGNVNVAPGDAVTAGQTIGTIGGQHLHHEVIRGGTPAAQAAIDGLFGSTKRLNGQEHTLDPATYYGGLARNTVVRGGRADGGHVDAALRMIRRHFDEGGTVDGALHAARRHFNGDDESFVYPTEDYQSPDNGGWGDPESASDFFRADRAMMANGPRARSASPSPSPSPVAAPMSDTAKGDPDNKADFFRADRADMTRKAAEADAIVKSLRAAPAPARASAPAPAPARVAAPAPARVAAPALAVVPSPPIRPPDLRPEGRFIPGDESRVYQEPLNDEQRRALALQQWIDAGQKGTPPAPAMPPGATRGLGAPPVTPYGALLPWKSDYYNKVPLTRAAGGSADDSLGSLYNKYVGQASDEGGKAWWQAQTAGMSPEEQDAAAPEGGKQYAANEARPRPAPPIPWSPPESNNGVTFRGSADKSGPYVKLDGGFTIPLGDSRMMLDASYGTVPNTPTRPNFSVKGRLLFPFARGGLVDDALRVVREHHADGEAVGPTTQQRMRETIAGIDPERSWDQPVKDPATMGEAWDRTRQNYQNFPRQEGEAVARPLELGIRDQLAGYFAGGAREPGAQFRRGVADLLLGSTGLPNSGTLGVGVADAPMVTGIPLALADIAHDIGQGDYGSAAMGAALPAAFYARGPLGAAGRRVVEIAKDYAKPIAGAAGVAATLAPGDAEAAKLRIPAGVRRALSGTPVDEALDISRRASTRFPTGATATENPLTQQLTIGPAEMRATPTFAHNMSLLPEYPGFAHLKSRTPDEQLAGYMDQARGNLNFLYENAPQVMRERSPSWYNGANNFSDALSARYGIPRQSSSAAIASLSPQMDWFKNASLAERVGDVIFSPVASMKMSPEMEAFQRGSTALNNPANKALFDRIAGQKFSALADPLDQALWIRLYDEAHNPRNYKSITPEGKLGQYITNEDGSPAKIGWGSMNEIQKAVRAYNSGGDMNVISPVLGTKHKVRSFYNNIEIPDDLRFRDVTADTHAVAAAQLRPLSGSTPAVAHNLASGLSRDKQPPNYVAEKSSAITGVQGTYGANAEATRMAAADQGLIPRQMQSATWEPVRELFPSTWKNAKNVGAVDNIWSEKDAGNITAEQARKAIFELAGGFREPTWAKRGVTPIDPRKGSTYR